MPCFFCHAAEHIAASKASFPYQPAIRVDDKLHGDKADVQEGLKLSSIWPRHWAPVIIMLLLLSPLTLPCRTLAFHNSRTRNLRVVSPHEVEQRLAEFGLDPDRPDPVHQSWTCVVLFFRPSTNTRNSPYAALNRLYCLQLAGQLCKREDGHKVIVGDTIVSLLSGGIGGRARSFLITSQC